MEIKTKKAAEQIRNYMAKPVKLAGGNIKTGAMLTFSKLMGNEIYKTGSVACSGSCGGFCNGCKSACYVKSSYRYDSVILNHMKNTLAFRADIEKAFNDIDGQLTRKRKKAFTVRINQSGEIESRKEFKMWIELANKHPETHFYIYSKAFKYILPVIQDMGALPENFTVLISIWENYGIAEFNSVKHIRGVKAFVYMNGFNYKAHGIEIQTECNAYKDGKLNKAITCDKCRKCFNNNGAQVVGCHEH